MQRRDALLYALERVGSDKHFRVLEIVAQHGPVTPKETSELLDEPLGRIAYRFRQLVEAELIELVRTEPRRGAMAHFYGLSDEAAQMLVALA